LRLRTEGAIACGRGSRRGLLHGSQRWNPNLSYGRVDKYLGSARNPRVRSLDIFAVGDVFIQTLSLAGLASAPGVVEEIQVALELVGSVAGVDDGQSRVS
jgi:hypothetical protein